jgi:hypothetical protein
MWSRGIVAVALCATCVTATLAALPPGAGPAGGSGADSGLMRALELAPQAVATWKSGHDGHAVVRKPKSKGRVKSRLHPFGIEIFAGSLEHGRLGDPAGQ